MYRSAFYDFSITMIPTLLARGLLAICPVEFLSQIGSYANKKAFSFSLDRIAANERF